MHFSIYAAGKLLAEFGREEVNMCIRGLQQYGVSYEDAFDQAAEIQRMYAASSRVDPTPPPIWQGVNGAENNQAVGAHFIRIYTPSDSMIKAYSIPGGASYSRNTTLAPMLRR